MAAEITFLPKKNLRNVGRSRRWNISPTYQANNV